MKRVVFSAAGRAVGQVLALVIAIATLQAAAYLGTAKLDGPADCIYLYGQCVPPLPGVAHSHPMGATLFSPPTQAAWQIPAALLLAVFGLGIAGAFRRDLRGRRLERFAATNGTPVRLSVR